MRFHSIAASLQSQSSLRAAALLTAMLAFPHAAQAQVASGELEVRLNITASCDITGSAGGSLGNAVLDFGTASLLQAAIDRETDNGVQALEVLCNPGVAYTLTFNAGQNAGGINTNRAMRREGGTELVRYQIYTDAARNNMLTTINGTGTGAAQTIIVYGRVPAQSAPLPGSYRDTVTITMSF